MFKTFVNITVIGLLCIAALSNFLRLVYLLFRPKFLENVKFIANYLPSKTQLALYYLLTIMVCIYALLYKLDML